MTMRDDVQRASLEAAMKVTMGALVLTGCTGSESRPATTGNVPAMPASTTSADPASTASTAAPVAASLSTEECQALVKATFPTPSDYPGDQKDITTQVATCCQKLLRMETSFSMPNRWDCCANLTEKTKVQSACTPWGPPMPPPMPDALVA